MYKLISFLLFGLITCSTLQAQNIKYFELAAPEIKITNCLYNKLDYIDSRPDTTSMGTVQTGFFNRVAKVIPKSPLTDQFSMLLKSLIDNTAANGSLVLQVRQFSYAELTGSMSEKGFCYVRAELYAQNAGQYQKITSLDTVVVQKSSIDVTEAILKAGANTITSFITANLHKKAAGQAYYSLNDVLHIDSVEKQQIKVYTTTSYVDGLYATYQSFKDQVPDKQLIVDGYEIYPDAVRYAGPNGKPQKIKMKNVYAIVHRGELFIATEDAYCPAKRVDGDFFFTGKVRAAANGSDVAIATAVFGVLGGLMAANTDATFEMKIDHKNGTFIRLKEVVEKPVIEQ